SLDDGPRPDPRVGGRSPDRARAAGGALGDHAPGAPPRRAELRLARRGPVPLATGARRLTLLPSQVEGPRTMRALFFGTPEIAVPSLEALVQIADVVGVVCQPDRPAGRGLELRQPPVKRKAL